MEIWDEPDKENLILKCFDVTLSSIKTIFCEYIFKTDKLDKDFDKNLLNGILVIQAYKTPTENYETVKFNYTKLDDERGIDTLKSTFPQIDLSVVKPDENKQYVLYIIPNSSAITDIKLIAKLFQIDYNKIDEII